MTTPNPNERVEGLLALLLMNQMKDESMTDKSIALVRVGFASPEIAQLLGTTRLVVNQLLYVSRKGKSRKSKGKQKTKRPRRNSR